MSRVRGIIETDGVGKRNKATRVHLIRAAQENTDPRGHGLRCATAAKGNDGDIARWKSVPVMTPQALVQVVLEKRERRAPQGSVHRPAIAVGRFCGKQKPQWTNYP